MTTLTRTEFVTVIRTLFYRDFTADFKGEFVLRIPPHILADAPIVAVAISWFNGKELIPDRRYVTVCIAFSADDDLEWVDYRWKVATAQFFREVSLEREKMLASQSES